MHVRTYSNESACAIYVHKYTWIGARNCVLYLIGIVGVRMYVSYVHINISMIYMSLFTTTCMDVCTYIVTSYIRRMYVAVHVAPVHHIHL